ncbi:MAG: hypothetical protein AAGA55_02125 [Planctomycetota bacterium]
MSTLHGYTRDPWGYVTFYRGIRSADNPAGVIPAWLNPDSAEAWFKSKVNPLLKAGVTKIVANRMQGVQAGTHVSGSAWETLLPHQQDIIWSFNESHPEVLVPFIGSTVGPDPATLDAYQRFGDNSDIGVVLDPTRDDTHASWAQSLNGYAEAGTRDFIFDHGASMSDFKGTPKIDRFIRVRESLQQNHGIRIGVEPIPRVGRYGVQYDKARLIPCFADHWTFLNQAGWNDQERQIRFDPDTTRVFAMFMGNASGLGTPDERKAIVENYHGRGFIVCADDALMLKHAREIA